MFLNSDQNCSICITETHQKSEDIASIYILFLNWLILIFLFRKSFCNRVCEILAKQTTMTGLLYGKNVHPLRHSALTAWQTSGHNGHSTASASHRPAAATDDVKHRISD